MKAFEFSREGLEASKQYKDYIGIAKETFENNPELLPLALAIVLGISILAVAPAASAVAYKTSIYDSGMVAFKFMNGGF